MRDDPGERGKRDGMARAARNADPKWWAASIQAAQIVAKRKEFFSSDDVVRQRDQLGHFETHETRAMGPVMLRMAKDGVCEKTGDVVASDRPQNHKYPKTVWRSLIFTGPKRHPHYRRRRPIDPRQYELWDDGA